MGDPVRGGRQADPWPHLRGLRLEPFPDRSVHSDGSSQVTDGTDKAQLTRVWSNTALPGDGYNTPQTRLKCPQTGKRYESGPVI